jgi:hypothetical protein
MSPLTTGMYGLLVTDMGRPRRLLWQRVIRAEYPGHQSLPDLNWAAVN